MVGAALGTALGAVIWVLVQLLPGGSGARLGLASDLPEQHLRDRCSRW